MFMGVSHEKFRICFAWKDLLGVRQSSSGKSQFGDGMPCGYSKALSASSKTTVLLATGVRVFSRIVTSF
jgi:hypothetical protein